MKTFKEYINESKIIVYHGDNFGTKSLVPKLMNDGNNQEGIGIYFGSLNTAKDYGKDIVSASINHARFIPSREPIGDFVNTKLIYKLLLEMYKIDKEEMYYLITDYVEVAEPEDLTKYHIDDLANIMIHEQVRNFQITLANIFGVTNFVVQWNKIIKIDGTYHNRGSENWYAIINTNIKLNKV
jgi:hypothetical protein